MCLNPCGVGARAVQQSWPCMRVWTEEGKAVHTAPFLGHPTMLAVCFWAPCSTPPRSQHWLAVVCGWAGLSCPAICLGCGSPNIAILSFFGTQSRCVWQSPCPSLPCLVCPSAAQPEHNNSNNNVCAVAKCLQCACVVAACRGERGLPCVLLRCSRV